MLMGLEVDIDQAVDGIEIQKRIVPLLVSLGDRYGATCDDLEKAIRKLPKAWRPNQHKLLAKLENWAYVKGAQGLLKIQEQLCHRFGLPERRTLAKAGGSSITVGLMLPKDYQELIDRIVEQYFPGSKLAEEITVRSYLTGKLLATKLEPGAKITPSLLDVLKVPLAVKTAHRAGITFTDVEHGILRYAEDYGASLIRTENALLRERIKRTCIQAERNHWGTRKLASELFDRLGTANRDWRRIALTETAFNLNNGILSVLAPGSYVYILSQPDACPYCMREMHLRIFRVVDPGKEPKDWEREVWLGKTNEGRYLSRRSREGETRDDSETWKPCCPAHPHCRCIYLRLDPFRTWIDEEGVLMPRSGHQDEWEDWARRAGVDEIVAAIGGR
jgi:hypothetical protein